ncbi:MAG: pyridoxamine 5'-phosphate oxidase [Candidatus Paracaedibacteraceae bacterium]|nr:pyridoxamine 5'-phosphate oxidase [Candidatus Paracaedibacteraceae bacterium]
MDIINPPDDPIGLFNDWLQQAGEKEINDPNAMALATVDKEGRPSVRIVLLKGITDGNFIFFTNLESRKGNDLKFNCHVALCFYWKSLRLQVRIEGIVERVSDAEADAYFATRPVGARIAAWASQQSRPLNDRSQLEEALAAYSLKFGDEKVPRPPYWSGFRVIPQEIEFWEEQPFRLHHRLVYTRDGSTWKTKTLYP